MKKRQISAICCATALSLTLVACGGGSGGSSAGTAGTTGSSAAAVEEAAPKGETFDTGEFSVLVPEGWKAFPVSDIWSEEEDAIDSSQLYVYKGATEELDMFSKCGATISHYGPETSFLSAKDWYDDVEDLSPVTTGNITWEGYTGSSFEIPCAVFHTGEDGSDQFAVTFTLAAGETESISITDEDVLAILGSVQVD